MLSKKMQEGLAGIEYHGLPGITSHCLDAIVRLIHFGDIIEKALLLSFENRHSFVLYLEYERPVAIKSGFSSGYSGEGPSGLAKALRLLERHCGEIYEFEVSEEFLDRLDDSCLSFEDLKSLSHMTPVRPTRYYDYIFDQEIRPDEPDLDQLFAEFMPSSAEVVPRPSKDDRELNNLFPSVIPFRIIDDRIVDLAFKFKFDPDGAILTAYKRLEGILRRKIGGSDKSGAKLISDAFLKGENSLYWSDMHETEQRGRLQIFTGAFMAFRNRRAHSEVELPIEEELREFLVVNELFLMERAAELRELDSDSLPDQ